MVFLNGGERQFGRRHTNTLSVDLYSIFLKIIHSGTPYEDFHGVPLRYHANAPHSRVSDILCNRGFDQLG